MLGEKEKENKNRLVRDMKPMFIAAPALIFGPSAGSTLYSWIVSIYISPKWGASKRDSPEDHEILSRDGLLKRFSEG
jgi:hypothetical protein